VHYRRSMGHGSFHDDDVTINDEEAYMRPAATTAY
jgi:hypothetical protein